MAGGMQLSLLKVANGIEQSVLDVGGDALCILACDLGFRQKILRGSMFDGFGKIVEQCFEIHFAAIRVSGHRAFLPASVS
jgi:hypothetical protein